MSKKYIYMLLIFLLFIVTTSTHFIKYLNVEQVKEVFDSNNLMCKYSISNIKENTDKYNILVYYPVTEIKELNENIMEKINSCIDEFKSKTTGSNETLTIKFNSFENDIYTSFVFDVNTSASSEHSKECVFCLNYNNKENKIIIIDDIIKSDNNNLKNISKEICSSIKENEELKGILDEESIVKYFDLNKEKYECFYFCEKSLVFCFNPDIISPTKCGVIYVSIPMDIIL